MARIIAIDYGAKRSGIAWTDPLQIIATAVGYVETSSLMERLRDLCAKESVESFVMGLPYRLDGSDTDMTAPVKAFAAKLRKAFPDKPVEFADEQFSSRMAMDAMLQAGLKKKKRREKGVVDQVAATLILQDYLEKKA